MFIEQVLPGRQGQAERRAVRHPPPHPARHRAAPRRGDWSRPPAAAGPTRRSCSRRAATAYLDMWKKYSEAGLRARRRPAASAPRRSSTTRRKAFQAARLLAKAIAVRKILIDPKYNLNNTELAKKAVYEIGGNYQAIAVYDEAAGWYERYAAQNPKADKAPEALSGRGRASPRPRPGGPGDQGRRSVQQELRLVEAGAGRADRLRHRRPLRREGGLGRGAQAAHRAR